MNDTDRLEEIEKITEHASLHEKPTWYEAIRYIDWLISKVKAQEQEIERLDVDVLDYQRRHRKWALKEARRKEWALRQARDVLQSVNQKRHLAETRAEKAEREKLIGGEISPWPNTVSRP